jgi:REP-associated tyrosine transposase
MLANHVIFGMYGFWLPNDPRGSWSDFVGSWELFRYGPATKTTETRSLAGRPHDRHRRLAAKSALARKPVTLNWPQIEAVADGFGDYAERSSVRVLACAVLPDHVHLVLATHRLSAKRLVIQLKGVATRELARRALHPFPSDGRPAKCFARGAWDVFLDTERDVEWAVRYVEENPVKEGMVGQKWGLVEGGSGRGKRGEMPRSAARRG